MVFLRIFSIKNRQICDSEKKTTNYATLNKNYKICKYKRNKILIFCL